MTAVRVLYFGGLREAVGLAEEALDLSEAGVRTVGDLAGHLAGLHREYAARSASVRLARNESFADAGEAIEDGDVIAPHSACGGRLNHAVPDSRGSGHDQRHPHRRERRRRVAIVRTPRSRWIHRESAGHRS